MGELRIVGTAHVSRKSMEEVAAAVDEFDPTIIAVELDPSRYAALKRREELPPVSVVLESGNFTEMLVQWLLAYIQRRIGMDIGVEPGAEMRTALEIAESRRIPLALVDRDIRVTLARFWAAMSFLEKAKLIHALALGMLGGGEEIDADQLTREDIVTLALEEFRKFSPGGARALIDERDAFIARGLIELAQRHERVLAVVGAGHVPGIRRYLDSPESLPGPADLAEVRRGFPWGKVLAGALLLLFVLLCLGILFSGLGTAVLVQAILYWIVLHAILAGLCAFAAGGHPFSILTACAVSWMTALNPLVAAGWFAAITEAKVRRPSPSDFRRIMEAESFRDMRRIPLFRVVLVAALTNLGSTVATFAYYFTVLPLLGIDPSVVLMQGLGNFWAWLTGLLSAP